MPRFRTLAFGLGVIACAGALLQLGVWWTVELISSQPGEVSSGPHLQLVTDQLNLGRIAASDVVEAKFVIANTGTEKLILRQASAVDDATPALTSVAAGRTSEIVLQIEGSALPLAGTQQFRFLTNDPARPEFWLIVRASIGPRKEHSVLVRGKLPE